MSLTTGILYHLRLGVLSPYARGVAGAGGLVVTTATSGNQAVAPVVGGGGGLEVKIYRGIGIRADYEILRWLPVKALPEGQNVQAATIGLNFRVSRPDEASKFERE
jgi:hypothetical protein